MRPGAPDLVQGDFERYEDAGGGDEQHDDGGDLHAAVRAGEDGHVADNEVLAGGEEVADLVRNDGLHGGRVEDLPGEGQHEDDEGKEGEDDVGGHAEGVGMHFSLCEIAGERLAALGQGGVFRQASERRGGR